MRDRMGAGVCDPLTNRILVRNSHKFIYKKMRVTGSHDWCQNYLSVTTTKLLDPKSTTKLPFYLKNRLPSQQNTNSSTTSLAVQKIKQKQPPISTQLFKNWQWGHPTTKANTQTHNNTTSRQIHHQPKTKPKASRYLRHTKNIASIISPCTQNQNQNYNSNSNSNSNHNSNYNYNQNQSFPHKYKARQDIFGIDPWLVESEDEDKQNRFI